MSMLRTLALLKQSNGGILWRCITLFCLLQDGEVNGDIDSEEDEDDEDDEDDGLWPTSYFWCSLN